MTADRSLGRMPDTLRSVLRFRPLETDPVARRLRRAASVADLRRIARRRLPRGVFDYIDGGAEDERTLAANSAAFARTTFRPRVLRDVGTVDPATTLLGRPLPLPLVLAPTGFTRIADPDGELAVARAASRAGLPYTLSTLGTRSIEEVAAASGDGPRWFQVYVWRDRGLVREMVERAAAAGYEALVLTVDTAVLGRRERDVRAGLHAAAQDRSGHAGRRGAPPGLDVGVRAGRADPVRQRGRRARWATASDAVSLSDYINSQFDPSLSWRDVEWLRSVWDGPIVLKGIQTVDDAVLAAEARGRGDRPVQPRRPPARLGPGAARPGGTRWWTPWATGSR